MKTNSFAFSSAWGLSISAIAPWIIGTQFLNMPAAAASSGWENPCIEEPQSEECQYFTEFLDLQEQLWLTAWLLPYVHEASIMTLEPTADPAVFDVDVWLDAGLDYEDPNLTEADVLNQIVGSGHLHAEVALLLASDSAQEIDPDDGTITTIEMNINVVGGTLTGTTGIDIPILGVATITDAFNNLGDNRTVHHFVVINLPASVEEAIAEATKMAEAMYVQTSGGGGGIGQPPSPEEGPPVVEAPTGPIPCMMAPPGSPQMSAECCACFGTYGTGSSCYSNCRWAFRGALVVCAGGVALGGATCFAKCMLGGTFLGPMGWMGCAAICGIGTVVGIAGCIAAAYAGRRACESLCDMWRNQCLIDQGCPDLVQ